MASHTATSHRPTPRHARLQPQDSDTRPALVISYRGHRQGILSAAFRADSAGAALIADSRPPTARARTRSTSRSRQTASDAMLTPPRLVSGGADGAVMLWDSKPTTRALRFIGHRGPVLNTAFSPKASLIASVGHDGYARLWCPNLRRTSTTFPAMGGVQTEGEGTCAWRVHSGAARALAFGQDGSDYLYTVGDDKCVKCWDLNYVASTGGYRSLGGNKFVGSFGVGGHSNWVRAIALPRAGAAATSCLVASGGDDALVCLWDTRTRRPVHTLCDARASIRGLSFDRTGYNLACGDASGVLNVYDLRQAAHLAQHYKQAHHGALHQVHFSPIGQWLLTAGEDGTARLWDAAEGYLYCSVEAHEGPVRTAAFSDDGQFFATGGKDGILMVWRSGLAGRRLVEHHHHSAHIADSCTTRQGDRLRHSDPTNATTAVVQRLASVPIMEGPTAGRPPLSPAHPDGRRNGLEHSNGKGNQKNGTSAMAERSPSTDEPAVGTLSKPPPSHPRSFERSDGRYTRMTPPQPSSPHSAAAEEGEAVPSTMGTVMESSVPEDASTMLSSGGALTVRQHRYHDLVVQAAAVQRLDNLETAVVSLAEHVREDQQRRDDAAEALREELDSRHQRQRTEMTVLKEMVQKLVTQQGELLTRLSANSNSNSELSPQSPAA